ncbi:MAG: response regulator, partial [Ignavibacterium sp.]
MTELAKNSKILVCDDEEALCYLLKEQLIEEGFDVDAVYDGKYAIDAIKQKNYDVVLLDLNMREVQGEEVLKFVKDEYPSIEVIILSSQTEMKKAIQCIKAGAYDYIPKPHDPEELILTINRALEHKNLILKTEILEKEILKKHPVNIIGTSKALHRV